MVLVTGGSDRFGVICQITVEKRRLFIMWQNLVHLCSFIFLAVQRMWFAWIVFWRIFIMLFWH